MQYILLLPQLTHMKLFCIKVIQRASTRLERYRYVVQKLWISWNIQFSISFSCFPLLLQSHLIESIFWHFYLIFFPHYFSNLYAFYPLLNFFFSPFLFHLFLFLPCFGVGIHFTVVLQEDHVLCFLMRRKDWLYFWYKSLHQTWQ